MEALLFKNQDYRLRLDTGIDLTDATVTKILYKKPNTATGNKGEWTATKDGATTIIYYDVTNTENDTVGTWIFQSYVELNGKKYYGEEVKKEILNNLK